MENEQRRHVERTYFVGNLAWAVDEAALRAAFEEKGHRTSLVKISREADGERSRGFGFVRVLTDDAEAVITSMYGHEIEGRAIRVDYSTSSRTREEETTTTTDVPRSWGARSWTR